MSNIIDSIRMSGTTYAISDSGGTKVVEITQSDYDNLPTSAKTANIMYVITDAEPFDVSNYYTKAETSGATELATAFAATQPKLSAGTNITIDANNVISAEGGGSITIDPSLDSGSTNPVANSAITTALNDTVKLTNLSTYYINGFTAYVNRIYPIFHRFNLNNQSNGNAWWFGKINDKYVITTGQTSISPSGLMDLHVIETSAITTSITSSSTDAQVPSAKAVYNALGGGGGIDSGTVQTMIDQSISGKTNQTDFVSHSGNTSIHVTAQDKTNWNNKSDFSGSYNDLTDKPTIPIVPTNVSSFNNDAGYITSNDISGKTNQSDFVAHSGNTTMHVTASEKSTWNAKSDFSGSYNDLTDKPTLFSGSYNDLTDKPTIPSKTSDLANDSNFATSAYVDTKLSISDFNTYSGSVNTAIGNKANSSDVYLKTETSGATQISDALSGKVNISDNNVSAFSDYKVALESGKNYTSDNISTFYLGTNKTISSTQTGDIAIITTTNPKYPTITINCNYSNGNITQVRTTSGITSSIVDGVAQITLTSGTLAEVVSASNGGVVFLYKQYTSGQTADVVEDTVYDALKELSNNKLDYIYKDEIINSQKTFLWGSANDKPIIFKQSNNGAKIGFQCKNSASTNNEIATFEFRPDSYIDSSRVMHPLLYLGHYRNINTANAGVVQTMVGFRQYDQKGRAAYHYLMPLPAEAKTPFSLTTEFKNYFAPLGFKNGSTMITTDNTGVADFSDVLGGLKLVKLSQSEYDSLATKDNSTLYVIVN